MGIAQKLSYRTQKLDEFCWYAGASQRKMNSLFLNYFIVFPNLIYKVSKFYVFLSKANKQAKQTKKPQLLLGSKECSF